MFRLLLIAAVPVDVMTGLSKILQVVLVLSMAGFAGGYAKRTGPGMRACLKQAEAGRYRGTVG